MLNSQEGRTQWLSLSSWTGCMRVTVGHSQIASKDEESV